MRLAGFFRKYKELSDTAKATIWYVLCNILQKIAAFAIIPFLARMLTTSEYGLYAVFLSWTDIIEIFATMRIYSNGYVSGLIKNREDQERYTSTIQLTAIASTIACFIVFLMFSNQICDLIQIKKNIVCYMFLSFFATSSVGIWSSRQRVNNRYKLMVLVTMMYSVLAPVAAVICTYYSTNRLESIIMVRIVIQFIIAAPFFVRNIYGSNLAFDQKYYREAILYNLPLLPYYLSMVILNNSDRIMIRDIVGDAEAGIYSVAYSLAMAVFVFVGALNLSLQPWIFNKFKTNQPGDASKVITLATCMVALLNTCMVTVSPELIHIIASYKYIDAVWTMPPIICSLLIIFVYQQVLNVHFYYGKTKIVFFVSVIGAVLNLVLNYYFINMFGYIAAGYTTLVSYSVIAILYVVSMKKIAQEKGMTYEEYYNISLIFGIIIAFGVVSALITLLYSHPVIRYGVALIVIAISLLVGRCIIGLRYMAHTGNNINK